LARHPVAVSVGVAEVGAQHALVHAAVAVVVEPVADLLVGRHRARARLRQRAADADLRAGPAGADAHELGAGAARALLALDARAGLVGGAVAVVVDAIAEERRPIPRARVHAAVGVVAVFAAAERALHHVA